MHLYSIMPLHLADNHLDEVVQDIKYQYENGIATTALMMMTLVPEGNPPIDKAGIYLTSYDRIRDRLLEEGKEIGILVQASIGHGWVLDHMFPFQRYTNLTDGKEVNVVCPYDEGFRKHFKGVMAQITSHRPKEIMVDDDFRLMFREGKGCACPLHMKAFNRLAGVNMTREELYKHTQGTTEEDIKYTKLFIETQRDSLIGAARAFREGVDSVDPKMPVSYCACGSAAEFADEIAHILAGKKNPVIVRLNNGTYAAAGPRFFSDISLRAAAQAAVLKGKVDAMLAETDTCPQNRYSTSAQMCHAHFVATILEGATGAKHWITRLHTFEPRSGEAYRKKLSRHRGMYERLSEITSGIQWLGCRMPVSKTPGYGFGAMPSIMETNGWSSCVMERLGIPMYFSSASGGAVFMDGPADAYLTDDEIREIFKGTVFLASDTAKRLNVRGFSNLTGVEVETWTGENASGEILDDKGSITNAQMKICSLTKNKKEVKAESMVFHLKDGKTKQMLFPGVTSYKNPVGGTSIVFSGTSKTNYNIVEAFSFLTESRKKQLVRLLKENGGLQAYYPGDEEVYLRLGKTDNNAYMCVLFNLGLDVIGEIELCTELDVKRITRMLPDGSEKEAAFEKEGERIKIEESANVLDPVILFLYE
ncbi:MAG: hypothetical protein E7322_11875 [Clostridiales bacterium]|nr:hypothetical protein [Clostridiales bacterium]